jgi:lysophospholipase L1-like esterase
MLGKLLGARFLVQNFGVSGATLLRKGDLPYWSTGAYAQASAFAPDVVIIKLGTNDSKPQNWAHKDEFAADCRDLVTHFVTLPSKPHVFVCLPVPAYSGAYGIRGDVIANELIPMIKQVATETKTPVLDLFTAMSNQPQYFPDGIHPNDAGYEALAGHIHRLLTGAPVIAPAGEIFFDPLTQVFDVYPDQIRAARVTWIIPNLIQEPGRGKNFSRMVH